MLTIGIPYELCGTLNPRKIKPFEQCYDNREKLNDTHNWQLGGYVCEAVSVVMANAFSKKGTPKKSYRDKPYYMEKEEHDIATGKKVLSEEEKAIRVQRVFEQLNATLSAKAPVIRNKE